MIPITQVMIGFIDSRFLVMFSAIVFMNASERDDLSKLSTRFEDSTVAATKCVSTYLMIW